MRLRVFALACLALVVMGATRIPDVRVVVIVNSANPASTMRREQVAKIFLRQIAAWDDGEEILPVDQIERSPVRVAFTRDVQGLTVRALKMYWQKRIFSGDESPPPERVTDSDVLTYVRSNSGAIGYVLEGTELGTGVKPIAVTEMFHEVAR
jgi:ABC-type phosphate transport system substrate-binding protein